MYLIGDKHTAVGLQLGGFKKVVEADENSVGGILENVKDEEKMVILTSSLAKAAERDIEKLRKRGIIVTTIPDMFSGHEDVTRQLVKEAIGFDINK